MKLYLLTQDVNNDYDTFDSCVVVAKNVKDAALIAPSKHSDDTWCNPEDVKVEYIGEAKRGLAEGSVVIASFNAG